MNHYIIVKNIVSMYTCDMEYLFVIFTPDRDCR
jgi:hypothetical protein